MLHENQYPALLLNADWQPVQIYPLSTITWQEAIKAVISERVSVVEEYDTEIHSSRQSWRLPSVVALKEYINRDKKATFSRFNVFLRDNYECQYCGNEFETKQLTFDHVVPRARGGTSNWSNVVSACSTCNRQKGSASLKKAGMRLLKTPQEPTGWELYIKARKMPQSRNLHNTWIDYLYWDTELGS